MKLVVITGCLGLIGHHVARECLAMGYKVYGIDKLTYAANYQYINELSQHNGFTFIKGDIATLDYLPDCDYVINIAAESHVGNSIVGSSEFIHSNITGVQNLLDLIRFKQDNVCRRPTLFHFSTDEVYGDIVDGEHIETDFLKPSNPYSSSKAAADMLIYGWARTYGLNYIIFRPTNNYGIGQYPEKLIPLSVKLLMRDKKIRLHNAGKPIRNWLHAADTARAVTTIIESGSVNEIYNVAGGFEQKNYDTVSKIIKCYFDKPLNTEMDISEYINLTHVRQGQDVRYALNDNKLRSLGWKPERTFDNEIKDIVHYYKNNFKW
jgi:dTDP-glucose 4,6-dehydratase